MRVRKANHRSSPVPVTQHRTHMTYPGRSHAGEAPKRDRFEGAVLVEPDHHIVEEADGTWSYTCPTCRLTIVGWADQGQAEEQHAIHERTRAHIVFTRRA